ncbi:hypothetical protein MtrunA17_Chr4g0029021 [Medicago truncatula]|uniref:Uncharacterized protein n=1 Tax=Medicago truncatula TaxID=3880 RepID=A0A396I541_MEDTR|nr:hypothetical protein MtrunA17_Chr4g0029021 [Medicago truncatula]
MSFSRNPISIRISDRNFIDLIPNPRLFFFFFNFIIMFDLNCGTGGGTSATSTFSGVTATTRA